MASTFMGLSIASRGMMASQTGLAVTTNNMSNLDTTGYSRQVVKQTAIGPAAVYSGSLIGSGANVDSVDRVRSFPLDRKYWQETGAAKQWEAKSTYLQQAEEVFGTTDSSTISAALDDFNTALESLSTDPSSDSVRAVVQAKAAVVCTALNDASSQLTQLRNDLNSDVKTTVAEINSCSQQIADLNQKITVAKASGASTNELEDQRGVLVDTLSGLVGIAVKETDNGALDITVAGNHLVSGDLSRSLECYTVTDSTSSQYLMYGIRWTSNGQDFSAGSSGSLNGYLEMRDGADSDSKGMVYFLGKLDEFAQTYAQAFNEGVTTGSTDYSGHADGVGLNGATNIRFFSYNDEDSATFATQIAASGVGAAYKNITAANITLSKEVQEDTDNIAAAANADESDNNEVLNDLISLCEEVNISGNATVDDLFNGIIADVGSASSLAQKESTRKSTITTYLNTSRSSVSGVSSDEETVNLTTYQAAYAASASMAQAWNKVYQTTINMVNEG